MRRSLACLLLLAAAAPLTAEVGAGLPESGRRPFSRMTEREIAATLLQIHGQSASLPERVLKVSERFLGVPYALGPLGEGPSGEFDRDPLYSFQTLDCTTFVEEVMALSLEPRLPRALKLLQKVRYKGGRVRYETRNHFPEADWVPNNAAAGYLRDITRVVAGDKTKTASKRISKRAWYESKKAEDLRGFDGEPPDRRAKRLARWRELGRGFPDEKISLDYLPIEALPELAGRIPSGTVANLVREDKEGAPVLISHQVLIVEDGGRRLVRHAAPGKGVEDAPLLEYFYRFFGSGWKLLGLNLNEIRAPR